MFPVLFSFGPIVLYSYSLFIFLAMFFGLFVMWKRGNEFHLDQKDLFDVIFEVAIWVFISARLGYVVVQTLSGNGFGINLVDWINVFGRPGWYFPAGLIGGWIAIRRSAKRMKWDHYQIADLVVTGLILAQAILAVGAFVSGVGYGASTQSILGIQFLGVYDKRYPVQLLEMLAFFGGFGYLWWVEGVYRTFSWYKGNRSQAATGFLTGIYLVIWGLTKLVGTLFRTPEMVVWVIRLDLVLPLVVALLGGLVLLKRAGFVANGIWRRVLDYFGLV